MHEQYLLSRGGAALALGHGGNAWALGHGGNAWALGRGENGWALARRSAAAPWTAGRGVRGSAHLQAADGDDLLPGPDLHREGVAAAADDGVGPIVQRSKQRHGTAAEDPDQPGGEELGRQLAGQVKTGAGVMPGQRKSRSI